MMPLTLSSRLFNLMNNRASLTWDGAVTGTSPFSRLFLQSLSLTRSLFLSPFQYFHQQLNVTYATTTRHSRDVLLGFSTG